MNTSVLEKALYCSLGEAVYSNGCLGRCRDKSRDVPVRLGEVQPRLNQRKEGSDHGDPKSGGVVKVDGLPLKHIVLGPTVCVLIRTATGPGFALENGREQGEHDEEREGCMDSGANDQSLQHEYNTKAVGHRQHLSTQQERHLQSSTLCPRSFQTAKTPPLDERTRQLACWSQIESQSSDLPNTANVLYVLHLAARDLQQSESFPASQSPPS